MRDFARFASTVLEWTMVAWCLLTILGLGSGRGLARAAAGAAIYTSGLLLWGLMIGGVGYAVVTAVREALAENRPPADPTPDESGADAKPTPSSPPSANQTSGVYDQELDG
jgi:hypothetical protein